MKFYCVSIIILSFINCGKSQSNKTPIININDTIAINNYFSFDLEYNDLYSYSKMLKINFTTLIINDVDSILKVMSVWDQKYRGDTIHNLNPKEFVEAEKIMKLLNKRKKIDSINYVLLRNITNQFGWPDNRQFSLDAINGAFYTILHMNGKNGENSNIFKFHIEKAYQNKQISSYHYAVLIDHILLQNKMNQKYGTHCKNKKGEFVFYNMEDIKIVNINRQKIGLTIMKNNTCELISY